ncbi:MAG: hypothetical protein M1831_000214 [Alyxoria varia]|nr:MAG: hypothetical protein M1831_000214 [Alyxoria varia]
MIKPDLLEQTIPQHFDSIVSAHGDRKAVISHHQSTILTFEALNLKSDALARGLEKLGVSKGDRVAVSLGNNIEYATTTYALFKIGAILVPLNPAFSAEQVIAALNHLSASFLIIGAETRLPYKPPKSNVPSLHLIAPDLQSSKFASESVRTLRSILIVNNAEDRIDLSELKALTPFESILEDGSTSDGLKLKRNLDPHDVVNIQFTSGTTSMPKAACLTHKSILNNGKSIGDRMLLTPSDIVCCPPPLFHCFGCILGYMATATHGSAIVFPAEAFDPRETLLSVQEHGCTALYGVPTMFLAELDLLQRSSGEIDSTTQWSSNASAHLQEHQVPFPRMLELRRDFASKLRTGIAAGTSVPTELMHRLHRTLNLTELTICYGMTETSPVSAMTTTSDPMVKRVESVGRPLPHVKVKVVDPHSDSLKPLGIRQKGELCVSGYLTMQKYWNDPSKTSEVLVEDHGEQSGVYWMRTGDEAIIDEDGYVRITGRLKDIIIRGGENIHPLDVENALLSCPGLVDVSAYGVPDARYGEVVAVSIVKQNEVVIKEDDIRRWVRERLSSHFVPKHIFWVDTLPKTPSGKVQRFKLKEEAIKLLA